MNWARVKSSPSVCAKDRAASVLPSPGKSSSSTCPPARIALRTRVSAAACRPRRARPRRGCVGPVRRPARVGDVLTATRFWSSECGQVLRVGQPKVRWTRDEVGEGRTAAPRRRGRGGRRMSHPRSRRTRSARTTFSWRWRSLARLRRWLGSLTRASRRRASAAVRWSEPRPSPAVDGGLTIHGSLWLLVNRSLKTAKTVAAARKNAATSTGDGETWSRTRKSIVTAYRITTRTTSRRPLGSPRAGVMCRSPASLRLRPRRARPGPPPRRRRAAGPRARS